MAALVAAVLVLATAPLSAGAAAGVVACLVPWAIVAGDVRIGPWSMAFAGVVVPGVLVVAGHAPGGTFFALLGMGWLAATGESVGAEITATVIAVVVLPVLIPIVEGASLSEEREVIGFFATGGLIAWCFGRVLRRERQLTTALREAQTHLNDAAAAQERQRIARDVHDVVGHSLTVMLLNVAGAQRVLSKNPAAAAEALERAEQVGRSSLQNVRAIVGLLRAPGEHGTGSPQPRAADIAALAQTAATAGLPVRAEVTGDLTAVGPYAGLAAYRLVQEALSNAEHHAPGADVIVRVSADDADTLAISVRNGPSPVPSGRSSRTGRGGTGGGTGLDGMRQRLAALGGTFSAGPDGDGWLVEASIPLQRLWPANTEGGR
ncbi:sensor histidine kinase [Dactylosporangium sp. NPDC000521]|uniref:sensor histidine kinase n=1 Tax=Dactylosporangium sp. NPDC000521 TaxID=3363975 RepID=UPI0036AA5B70